MPGSSLSGDKGPVGSTGSAPRALRSFESSSMVSGRSSSPPLSAWRRPRRGGCVVAEGTDVLAHELRIEARPETVFTFLTDPDKMTLWKGDSAQLDARPGGVYRVQIGRAVVVGEFVELDPPRRVVFTWGWEGNDDVPPGSSTVEVTLMPDGEATILRLVHRDLPEEQRAEHDGGWKLFLPRLAAPPAHRESGS